MPEKYKHIDKMALFGDIYYVIIVRVDRLLDVLVRGQNSGRIAPFVEYHRAKYQHPSKADLFIKLAKPQKQQPINIHVFSLLFLFFQGCESYFRKFIYE